jgi:CelD/BcsL family acetyltransferase involved in cellulose biosynthesis
MGYSAGRDLLPPVLRDLARHSAGGQTVAVIDARGEAYRNLAAGHRHASLFSSPPWIEAVGTAYGLRIEASARLRDGRVEAAVPFCRIADIRGERIACLPFSDYCDPLVEDPADWADLVAPILAAGVPVRLRCLRNALPTADERFRVAGHALWHGVDLRRGEDEIWAGLDGQARQNVRKAERHGVVVRRSFSLDDLRLFHGMHASLRKSKYRMLAQPFAFFEALHAALAPGERISVLLAEVDGAAVAGILFLEWGDTLYYKFNASIDTHFRPNDLLLWEGIRFGRGRGLASLDFGLSDADQPGLVRYKAKFATEERAISMLEWRPEGHADPRGEEVGSTLHRMTRLLTEPAVPDTVTRAAGDELYRYFC